MRLKAALPATNCRTVRGYGDDDAPDTGKEALPRTMFLTKEQILAARNTLHYRPGSVFLGRVDNQMVGIVDNRHIITLAGSRSGKSACVLIPNLMLYPGSVLAIDPKGELAETTAAHRAKVLGQKVIVLDPFGVVKGEAAAYSRDQGHNPLLEIGRDDPDLIDDASLIAEALITETGGNDQYWSMAARNLVAGMILAAIVKEKPALSSIRHDLLRDKEGLTELFLELRDYKDVVDDDMPEALATACDLISRSGAFMLGRSETERSSVIASAIEQLAFLESPAMRRLFSRHDVSLRDLKRGADGKPVTIYLVLPAGRMGTHARWLRLMISLSLALFEREAAVTDETSDLRHPALMILEEFAALGHLRPIEQAAGFIAGSGVRLWSVLQDLSQLKNHYKEGWETFIGNAGIIQAFSLSDHTSLEYISKRLGDTTVEVVTPQDMTTRERDGGGSGLKRDFRSVPLMSPPEITMQFRRLSVNGGAAGGRSLILCTDTRPFIVDRVYWKDLEG